MKLGLIYKIKRMSHGLSQEGICESVYKNYGYILTQQQISDLENGKKKLEPLVLDYLNNTLILTWNDVIEPYIHTGNDLRDYLDLLKILLVKKSELSNKVMREMIKTVKLNRTKKNIEILIFAWFNFIFVQDRYHRANVMNQIRKLMFELPRKSQFKILEEMYLYSSEQAQFKQFIWIMKSLVKDLDPFKIKNLKVLNYYAESLFYEKKYLDVLLLSEKITPLISNPKCPEHFNREFNYRFALTYHFLGYYNDSRKKFREVMSRNLNKREVTRNCLNHIAFSYFKQKKCEKARLNWNKALEYCMESDPEILSVLTHYCYMEISESNMLRAKQLFDLANQFLNENQTKNETFSISVALHMRNRALFLIIEKRYRQAIKFLLESIKILQNTHYIDELITSQLGILYSLGRNAVDSSSSLIEEQELNSIVMLN